MNGDEIVAKFIGAFAGGPKTDAIDMIYDIVDDLLLAQNYAAVGNILHSATMCIEEIPMSGLLSLLTVTLPYKRIPDVASARTLLFAMTHIRAERDFPEEADALVRGLE